MKRPRRGFARLKKGGLMDRRLEAEIQKEIRRRAFQRADELRRKSQLHLKTQHTLTALQDVTRLQRPELESIADAVKLSLRRPHDHFFSIKHQILITAAVFSAVLFFCGMLTLI